MGIRCAEDPFNKCIFVLILMGTLSDPQHTHPGISHPPPPPMDPPSYLIPRRARSGSGGGGAFKGTLKTL